MYVLGGHRFRPSNVLDPAAATDDRCVKSSQSAPIYWRVLQTCPVKHGTDVELKPAAKIVISDIAELTSQVAGGRCGKKRVNLCRLLRSTDFIVPARELPGDLR